MILRRGHDATVTARDIVKLREIGPNHKVRDKHQTMIRMREPLQPLWPDIWRLSFENSHQTLFFAACRHAGALVLCP